MPELFIDFNKLGTFVRNLQQVKIGLEAVEKVSIAIGPNFVKEARTRLNENATIHINGLAAMLKAAQKELELISD